MYQLFNPQLKTAGTYQKDVKNKLSAEYTQRPSWSDRHKGRSMLGTLGYGPIVGVPTSSPEKRLEESEYEKRTTYDKNELAQFQIEKDDKIYTITPDPAWGRNVKIEGTEDLKIKKGLRSVLKKELKGMNLKIEGKGLNEVVSGAKTVFEEDMVTLYNELRPLSKGGKTLGFISPRLQHQAIIELPSMAKKIGMSSEDIIREKEKAYHFETEADVKHFDSDKSIKSKLIQKVGVRASSSDVSARRIVEFKKGIVTLFQSQQIGTGKYWERMSKGTYQKAVPGTSFTSKIIEGLDFDKLQKQIAMTQQNIYENVGVGPKQYGMQQADFTDVSKATKKKIDKALTELAVFEFAAKYGKVEPGEVRNLFKSLLRKGK
jgi:hypothetical protein